MRRSSAIWLAVVLLCLVTPAATQAPQPSESVRRIEVKALPITSFDLRDPSRRRFGALEFIGGLELSSPDPAFGGLSALHVTADGGHFLSVSDHGQWLRGAIRYDGDRPAGIADAEMAPMLGAEGESLAKEGRFDTESMAIDGGSIYVGIERVNQIVRFDYGARGLRARATPIAVPAAVKNLPFNKGLEAMIHVPRARPLGGTLIAFAERGLDAAGNHTAFLIGGPHPGMFALKRYEDFDISDATLLANGDVLLLERRFNWRQGLAVRIRRIRLAEIKPGAVLDGPVLFSADTGYQLDNMEGISAFVSAGRTVLTLISDDNFSPLQRTLLLQFRLVE